MIYSFKIADWHSNSIYFLKKIRENMHEVKVTDINIKKLKEEIGKISDPRRAYGNIRHKLEDIIIIGLLSTICMGEDFVDMEMFGRKRQEWLKTFLELPNGIPDSDTFRRVFERFNPKELSESLTRWLESERGQGSVINIDGKTIRGSKYGG